MIHPNMATMICLITTDAAISQEMLDKALRSVAEKSFNRVSVDGDTSVCDQLVIMGNGQVEILPLSPRAQTMKPLSLLCWMFQ